MPSLSTRESTPDCLVHSLITVWVCATLCFLTEVHVCEKEIDRSLEIMGRSCHIRSPRTHRLLFITLANALAAAKVKCAAFVVVVSSVPLVYSHGPFLRDQTPCKSADCLSVQVIQSSEGICSHSVFLQHSCFMSLVHSGPLFSNVTSGGQRSLLN